MTFGHHPDPAHDFVNEVDTIEAELEDRAAGLVPTMDLGARIGAALLFDGTHGNPGAVVAKQELRRIAQAFNAGRASNAANAARYEHLREQTWDKAPFCVVMRPKEAVKLGYDCPSHERLDAIVDKARGDTTLTVERVNENIRAAIVASATRQEQGQEPTTDGKTA